jgi:hypothetical protein
MLGLEVADQDLLPTHGETPSWINESTRVDRESASDWKGNGQLSKSMNCAK